MGRSCKPNRCSSRQADESCPFPPSTMIRSGNRTATKSLSFRAQRSEVEESRELPLRFATGSLDFARDDWKFAPRRLPRSLANIPLRRNLRLALQAGFGNTCAAPLRPCSQNHPVLQRCGPDTGGSCPYPAPRPGNTPWRRPRASPKYLRYRNTPSRAGHGVNTVRRLVHCTSDIGSIVLGKLPRVNRRVGLVVSRKSAIMSRNSAAFSKSIFSAASLHLFVEGGDHVSRFAFQKLTRLRDTLPVLFGADLA